MTQVLDHGSVALVDHMASDLKVVGAARVSIGKDPEHASKGEDSDRKLISFLMENGHGTPFEHAVFQFYVKAPIFVVREWQRHRMASYNEQSGRYSEFKPEFYVPDHLRVPDPKNRQSSVRRYPLVNQPRSQVETLHLLKDSMENSFNAYQELLATGIAREMARMVLPLSLYTSFWFTINARSLMNFLALRNHPAAQFEIRMYAIAIEQIFGGLMPLTYEAFLKTGRVAP